MSETVTLSNGVLTLCISSYGAEILSLKKDSLENIWQGDPEIWEDHAPVLFPICGKLRDNKYIYQGKEYKMGGHGFALNSEFQIEAADDTSATFLLCANDDTLKIYPFLFEFRVKYTLAGSSVNVEYKVTNTDNKEMYFSAGSHEGYSCPEGIEEYSLVFDEVEDLKNSLLTGPLLNHTYDHFGNCSELPLKYEYFPERDTLIFENLKTRKVTLKNRNTGRAITVDFTGADNLLIWTMDNAKFLCIEPWCGLPDYVDTNYDITKKAGILTLLPKDTFSKSHTITL